MLLSLWPNKNATTWHYQSNCDDRMAQEMTIDNGTPAFLTRTISGTLELSEASTRTTITPPPGLEQKWQHRPWETSAFVQKMMWKQRGVTARYCSVEALLEAGRNELYAQLPVLVENHLSLDVDPCSALNERPDTVITMERVHQIPDWTDWKKENGRPLDLVEIFCYRSNGVVARRHRGEGMKKHEMLNDNCLFHLGDAMEQGVGATLHAHPPRAKQGEYLLTRDALQQCMQQVSPHDVSAINKLLARVILQPDPNKAKNDKRAIETGFPWWLALANRKTPTVGLAVGNGVEQAWCKTTEGSRQIIIEVQQGTLILMPGEGRVRYLWMAA